MNRADEYISPDHQAELEDRAAELVDRDHLLSQERDDRAAGRAEQHEHDTAVREKWVGEWCDVKDRSGWSSDYGWGGYWDGVL